MKILEINKFNYLRRGAEKHFLDLASLLKENGNEVAIFSMDNPRNDFSPWKKYFVSYVGFGPEDSWKDKLKGLFRIYSFEAKRKIGKLLDDFRPDVVHIHNIYHHISPSILGEIKKRKIPIVMTVHDYNLICPNYTLSSGGKDWEELGEEKRFWNFVRGKYFKDSYLQSFLAYLEFAFNRYFRFYEKSVDAYIAPSVFVGKKLVAGGIPAEKIIVLPHFAKNDLEGASCDLRNRKKYAFYFGSISKEKNIPQLIEIFKDLPEVDLYLAGNLESGLQLPKAGNIRYLGFLNQLEIEKTIRNSMFVVSPSRLPETFGLIALEAIKNGKPFIGFDAGAYGEIIENNKHGYLCKSQEEMREKILQLATDEGLRILFSRYALERAADFSSNRYYRELMDIFRSQAERKERD